MSVYKEMCLVMMAVFSELCFVSSVTVALQMKFLRPENMWCCDRCCSLIHDFQDWRAFFATD